jgi:ketosteroid isomerase-like protein
VSAVAGHEGGAARIYRAYNAAENARDLPAMEALLAPDIAIVMNGRPALASAAGDAAAMAALFAAYPDYHREIVGIVDGGDVAAVRWRMVGRPAARLGGRLPDLDLHGCSVVEVRDGRMVRAALYAAEGRIDALLALATGDPTG